MKRISLLTSLTLVLTAPAPAAQAELPLFAADCPIGGNIDADRTGRVRVGGNVASVNEFNPNYYEAQCAVRWCDLQHKPRWRRPGADRELLGLLRRNGICPIL